MKTYKPTTGGRRGMTGILYKKLLTGKKPLKVLTRGRKRSHGRNRFGRITTRHKGGGHKRRHRDVDFLYDKHDIEGTIASLEYDPNRSGFIALIHYKDGERRYVLVPGGMKVGDTMVVSEHAAVSPGNRLPLARIPVGTPVFNIETKAGGGAKLVRSAGSSAEIIAQDAPHTHLKMPSSEVRKVSQKAWATIGAVSNEEHRLVTLGKAGRSRWIGRRPTVRGTAMNPVDHPHGGGEGRAGRGHRRARTAHGKPTGKGQKTRRAKKYSNTLIVSRRKVGKKRG